MTDAEKLTIAIQALRDIETGSALTGRWVAQYGAGEAVGESRNKVPQGHYDIDERAPRWDDYEPGTVPEVDCWGSDGPIYHAGEWLLPAEWEDYSLEDQCGWIGTVRRLAKHALQKIGE